MQKFTLHHQQSAEYVRISHVQSCLILLNAMFWGYKSVQHKFYNKEPAALCVIRLYYMAWVMQPNLSPMPHLRAICQITLKKTLKVNAESSIDIFSRI